MQGYYNQPNPMMGGGGGMGLMQTGMGMMQPGMMQGMGMQPGMGMGGGGMGMQNPIQQQMVYGNAWKQLGYDYQPPGLGYTPEASWGAWDVANARYSGDRLQRSFFDNIISGLSTFFGARHLSEGAARDAHMRVYYHSQGEDAGNKTLGGAAAYQAYLLWDRDHYSAYHSFPSAENRERLIGLAVAELFSLWDRVQPRSSRAIVDEASQFAAATAKHLFDKHYDLVSGGHSHGHGHRHQSRHSGYGADDDSDSDSEGRRHRRRSVYGAQPGMMPGGGMMSGQAGMMPQPGFGGMMPPAGNGMNMPGYGAMGMPGQFGGGMMGGQMNPMMGGQMNPMMGGYGGGMNPMVAQQMNPMMAQQIGEMGQMGAHGMPMGEAQSYPGMHPYTHGSGSGVAYGNQPIDQMGNPTNLAGARGWYGYGQPRTY